MLPLVLAIRFALELTLLAVYAWWGYHAAGVLGGAACAIAVAVVWGLLLSPKARFPWLRRCARGSRCLCSSSPRER